MAYQQASRPEDLEHLVSNASAKPAQLSYSLIKSITNNFSEEGEVGRGGFGVVYKGVIRNGKVAVKKLSVSQDIDDMLFMDEINCLIRAKHRNIVRFLGYCADTQGELMEANGRYIVADARQRLLCFEYVPNGNLHDYIKDVPHGDDWQIRYQIIKGISLGLHYIHKERITHLDLKPENVLLDAHMEPKITDFGLSRCMDKGKSRLITENKPGTRGFTAPEIIDKGEISFKADIYSFGVIVVKLLRGSNNNSYDTENWHKSLDVGCPQVKKCIEIARICMDADPDKRPTAGEIIEKLNQVNYPGSSIYQSSFDSKELIKVDPLELRFPFGTNEVSSSVNLVNFSDNYVAFMMTVWSSSTNSTVEYIRGILQPRRTYVVNVKREAQESMVCNDRYQVQSSVVTESFDSSDITTDMFKEMAGRRIAHEVVLGVVLSAPPQSRFLEVFNKLQLSADGGPGDTNSKVIPDSTGPLSLDLRFHHHRKYIHCLLYLTNNTDEYVAFRIKNDEKYLCWVKLPHYGILTPRSTHTLPMQREDIENRFMSKRLSADIILQNTIYDVLQNGLGDEYIDAFKDIMECDQYFEQVRELGNTVHEVTCDVLKDLSEDISDGIKLISGMNIHGYTEYIEAHLTKPWIVKTGHPKGAIHLLNYETQRTMGSFRVTTEGVYSPKFIARKQWIIVSSVDGFIHVCNYAMKIGRVKVFRAGPSCVTSLAVHPSKPYVVSSSSGGPMKLWDWDKDWECIQTFELEHTTKVCQVIFNPKDTNTFASVSEDHTVKFWNLHSPKCNHTLLGHWDIVNCLDFFTSGGQQYLITGSNDQTAKIWDMQKMTCVHTLESFISPVTSVLHHPKLPVLITGTEAGTIHFWSSTDFRIERILNICSSGKVLSLACSIGSRRIVIGQEKLISLMDIDDEEAIASKGNDDDMALSTTREPKEETTRIVDWSDYVL